MNTGYIYTDDTLTVCRRLFATCQQMNVVGKAIEAVSLSDGSLIEAQRRLLDVVRGAEIERHAAMSDEIRTVEIHEIYTSKRRYYSIRFDNGRKYERSMKRGEALKKKLHLVPGSGGCKFSTTKIL